MSELVITDNGVLVGVFGVMDINIPGIGYTNEGTGVVTLSPIAPDVVVLIERGDGILTIKKM